MADLFSSLTTAARSLEAQRFALDATGQNIANPSTPGSTRRVVDVAARRPQKWIELNQLAFAAPLPLPQPDAPATRRLARRTCKSLL